MKKYILLPMLVLLISSTAWAAPEPSLTISTESSVLLSDNVSITLSMNNTGDATGFYPMMQVLLPDGITCNSSCQSAIVVNSPSGGTAAVTDEGGYGVTGASYTNPVTGESVTVATNETLLFITPPVGTIAPGQPAIIITIPATLTASAALSVTETISGKGIFALGSLPNGVRGTCGDSGVDTICLTSTSASVTPSIVIAELEVTNSTAPCTGPNYTRQVLLDADVSTGATVTDMVISHTISDNLIVSVPPAADCTGGGLTISPLPTSCTYTEDANGGGSISLNYSSLVGAAGNDITISYSGYVQQFVDGTGASILDPSTGGEVVAGNFISTLDYQYLAATQPTINANDTMDQRSVHLQKSGSRTTDISPSGDSPGDTMTWSTSICVSDYFSFQDLLLNEELADGQTYVSSSFSMTVTEDGSDSVINESQASGPWSKDGSGITLIPLDLSNILSSVLGQPDGQLDGTSNRSGIQITYQSIIDENFVIAPGSGTITVDGGDIISSDADLDFIVTGTSNHQTSSGSASVEIDPITTVTKEMIFVNGVTPVSLDVGPGDIVTYKIRIIIPTGDAEDLVLTDYLPTPLFEAADPDYDGVDNSFTALAVGDTAPAAGEYRFTTSSTLTPVPTITQTASSNSIVFDFGDIENGASSSQEIIEILFSYEATYEPMADDLQLVNVSFTDSYNSESASVVSSVSAVANLIVSEPELSTTKSALTIVSGNGSISSGNATGVDAGDVIRFQVVIENTGDETAYDVQMVDNISALNFIQPGAGYNFSSSGCTGLVDTSTSSQVSFNSVSISPASSCTVTFELEVDSAAQWEEVITNTATTRFASQPGGTLFSPVSDTATTTLVTLSNFTKTYVTGTSTLAQTSDTTLAVAESVTFRAC